MLVNRRACPIDRKISKLIVFCLSMAVAGPLCWYIPYIGDMQAKNKETIANEVVCE